MARKPAAAKPRRRKTTEPILPGVNRVVAEPGSPGESPDFPIVALGASAGGLDAIQQFLAALPARTGMAFVVIQHLHPAHPSMMAEILGRSTAMPVRQVENHMAVEPDHLYVIPPGMSMVFSRGLLQLAPRTEIRGQHLPIDHFMRSLAEEHGFKSIGVVLSGTGSDGSLGIQEIKTAGGITFAQDDSAEQTSMPRGAVATGSIDLILAPAQIAEEIARIAQHPFIASQGELLHRDMPRDDPTVRKVLEALRRETGVDFSNYKRSTVQRRILRRMVLQKFENLHDYSSFMLSNPVEVEALYQDILINVTSFFRNADAYEAIKTHVFPKLVEHKSRHDIVRVWALGCSTGEEAYSVAMSFQEYLETSGKRVAMQVFATDLNGAGIEKARSGMYPKGIEQDLSRERLRRFFTEVDGSYRITKTIRDMCVFARQNVLADPPFSRLDLIACRNLLIYLEPVLQQKLMPVLHYALRPDGYLWLGSSETVGGHRELFEPVDSKHKIYQRKAGRDAPLELGAARPRIALTRGSRAPFVTEAPQQMPDAQKEADRLLVARYAPAAVVVNEELEIEHFRGDTTPYLLPSPGRASLQLLKMLREGLMVTVRGAIARARREGHPVREEGLRVKSETGYRPVNVVVIPLKAGDQRRLMVVFEEPGEAAQTLVVQRSPEAKEAKAKGKAKARDPKGSLTQQLEAARQELSATREYLQSVIEQQEATNEELQASNEEVQSANEELQSVNEELETSQEEIQSSNEELATVNDELQARNAELATSNADLSNLLASVQMAIVMLDWDLRIRRFTPAAEKLLNLIPTDVGRSLSDIRLNIEVADLEGVLAGVLESQQAVEREVIDRKGRWHLLRIHQYRTANNKVEGAVITLVDIDASKRAGERMRESESRFRTLADSAPVLIWVDGPEGRQFVNRAYEEFVGAPEAELRGEGWTRFIHSDDRDAFVASYQRAIASKGSFEGLCRYRRDDGAYRWMKSIGTARAAPGADYSGYVGSMVDITDLKEAEEHLREADRAKNEFLGMLAHELRNPLAAMSNATFLVAGNEGRDPMATRALEIIERQTRNMTRLVDDLLDVSRITHGKIHLSITPLDLQAAVRHAVNATAYEREHRRQKIEVSLQQEPLWVDADAARLDQILANILGNASKFTQEDGHIWLTLARDGEEARIVVRDDGMGIDPAYLERVFDLFIQVPAGGPARTHGGIGIGLTLVRRLVEMHGGSIEARSAGLGKGSVFELRLPLGHSAPAKEAPRPAPAEAPPARRVLIVDDNRDAADALETFLSRLGHQVHVLNEGSEALAAARRFKPHVVLLDIGLPDVDGYEVARRLREDKRTRSVLLIALTGYGRDEDVSRGQEAGFDRHLTKPADPEEVARAVALAPEKA